LGQRRKSVVDDEDDAEKQYTLIKPAGEAALD
jgi:hypothetical protein